MPLFVSCELSVHTPLISRTLVRAGKGMIRRSSRFALCIVLQALGLPSPNVRGVESRTAARIPYTARTVRMLGADSLPRIDANDNRAPAGPQSRRVLRASGRAPRSPTMVTSSAPRDIRLLAQRAPARFVVQSGPARVDSINGYGFVVDHRTGPIPRDSVPVLSPTLVLRRGEPVRVTIINRLREPTAVHWHGIELKNSYFDGVPGWSGTAAHLAPAIAPGDSFVAEFTPPRAGTYIYHSHSNELVQLGLGLYGAIVVVDSGGTYDSTSDRTFVLGKNGPDTRHGRVNGQLDPTPESLTVGTTYRFRIVHINPDWRVFASLMADSSVLRWRAVAKDGADLPAHRATMRPARVLMGAGETADFEFTPNAPGMLRLEFATMLAGWRLAVPLRVDAPKR